MGEGLEERLARARDAVREKHWVAQRICDAQADRERVAAQLAAMAELVKSEQADVERASGFFRKLFGGRSDLTREQQELAAVKLQQEALAEEHTAIEFDLAQLAARAQTVAAADTAYASVLGEAEAGLRAGPHGAELLALAETDGKLRASRREVEEAINAGRAAHDAIVAAHQAAKASMTAAYGSNIGSSLLSSLGASATTALAADMSEHLVHDGLRGQLGNAQRALLKFQQECRDVSGEVAIDGLALTPLPGVVGMVARDLVWGTMHKIDDVGSEMEMMASYVSSTTMELRGRAKALDGALTELVGKRAAIVDPARERL